MARGSQFLAVLGMAAVLVAGGARAEPADEAARDEMIRVLELEVALLSGETGIGDVDPRTLAAMRQVPRHLFVPEELRAYAYGNHPLPIGHDQNIAAPLLVALMTDLAELTATDVVYETGTGAGYHAAVLSLLVAQVISVDVVAPLAEQAAGVLKELAYDNVTVKATDGYFGWPERGPYDAIIVKEAIDHVPPPLRGQLKPGGRLVMPLGPADGPQMLTVFTKDDDGRLREERIMPVKFSPLQGGERT